MVVIPNAQFPVTIHGHWEFRGGGWYQRPKFLKELNMKLDWNSEGVRGFQSEKPSVGEVHVWIIIFWNHTIVFLK